MNPVSFSIPRFGGFGDSPAINTNPLTEEELAEKIASLESQQADIEFQKVISQLPVDDLIVQLGAQQGAQACIKTNTHAEAPEIMPVAGHGGQLMPVPVELVLTRMFGLGENSIEDYKTGFQEQLKEQKDKLVEAANRRITMIREEIESRIEMAQALGKNEVPYAPGKEGKEKGLGIEITTLQRLLDRTA